MGTKEEENLRKILSTSSFMFMLNLGNRTVPTLFRPVSLFSRSSFHTPGKSLLTNITRKAQTWNDERWKSIECHFHHFSAVSFSLIPSLFLSFLLVPGKHGTRSSERNGRKNLSRTITWDASSGTISSSLSFIFCTLSVLIPRREWEGKWEM